LGSGKRSVVPDGVYIPKYEITVPKELVNNEHEIEGQVSLLLNVLPEVGKEKL